MIFEDLMVDSVIRAFKRCEVIDFDDNVYPRRPEHGLVEVGSVQQSWICAKVRTADGQAYEILYEKRENMEAIVSITGEGGLAGMVTLRTIEHRGRLCGELFKMGIDHYERLEEESG